MTEWLLLLAAVALTALTGFFVAAEFSLTTVDRGRVEEAAAGGDRRAHGVVKALRSLSTQLSAAQLGITLTTLVVGYLAEPALGHLLHGPLEALGLSDGAVTGVSYGLALALATVLQMLLGELGPKNLAIANPLAVAAVVAPGMRAFTRVSGPVVNGLQRVANAIVRRLGIEPREELDAARGADELAAVARRSAEEGDLSPVAARLLQRSLALRQKFATDVMTPRTRLWALRAGATAADVIAVSVESGKSRFPVYGADLDEVTGVVHVKHAVAVPEAERSTRTAGELAAPVLAVPSSLQLERLMDLLREQGLQIAVVVDEWGATHGVVTLEDIVEELVGEISDETDRPLRMLRRADDETWLLSGLLRPDEVRDRTGVPVPEGRYETLAGFLAERLQRLPEVGDTVDLEGARLVVESLDGRRVARVRAERVDVPVEVAA
ncbi:hemolysin family protein [Geodermatophilus sabuli]|uniref:Hemolysin, contains CBS domains n=1 Tax=Geodermatophilus sabuli TaxID=1564158 RepID=A0A285EFB6_9ACTN|nr:hemolysin family protein [Geodermatophilus sabuli]MBB3083523.1 CBS domain containing-hemolysin-like protein [Geodermatophilus sabuli]SNX96756.1 Hemolysin, contains CBS domains [Geodermatophilus sabuli]